MGAVLKLPLPLTPDQALPPVLSVGIFGVCQKEGNTVWFHCELHGTLGPLLSNLISATTSPQGNACKWDLRGPLSHLAFPSPSPFPTLVQVSDSCLFQQHCSGCSWKGFQWRSRTWGMTLGHFLSYVLWGWLNFSTVTVDFTVWWRHSELHLLNNSCFTILKKNQIEIRV